jgi:hypothetical protein
MCWQRCRQGHRGAELNFLVTCSCQTFATKRSVHLPAFAPSIHMVSCGHVYVGSVHSIRNRYFCNDLAKGKCRFAELIPIFELVLVMADHAATASTFSCQEKISFTETGGFLLSKIRSTDVHSLVGTHWLEVVTKKNFSLLLWSDQPDALRMHTMHVLETSAQGTTRLDFATPPFFFHTISCSIPLLKNSRNSPWYMLQSRVNHFS